MEVKQKNDGTATVTVWIFDALEPARKYALDLDKEAPVYTDGSRYAVGYIPYAVELGFADEVNA